MTARKTHRCRWCGEDIVKGEPMELVLESVRLHKVITIRSRYHPECRDAVDQIELHGRKFTPGHQIRGEYPCPNDTDGDGDCELCCDTPYRRILRGDNKPALLAESRAAIDRALCVIDRIRKAGL